MNVADVVGVAVSGSGVMLGASVEVGILVGSSTTAVSERASVGARVGVTGMVCTRLHPITLAIRNMSAILYRRINLYPKSKSQQSLFPLLMVFWHRRSGKL